METYAIHKRARIKPQLARMTLDLIRDKSVTDARNILNNTNTKASRLILKVLNSAVANAVNNDGAKEEELMISKCFINPGPTLKRVRYESRANVSVISKRTSHISVYVTDGKGA